jgi:hypothetical protein
MNYARQCKIESGKRTYFIPAVSSGNKIGKKQHDAPYQRMEDAIKIPVFNYSLHVPAMKRNLIK